METVEIKGVDRVTQPMHPNIADLLTQLGFAPSVDSKHFEDAHVRQALQELLRIRAENVEHEAVYRNLLRDLALERSRVTAFKQERDTAIETIPMLRNLVLTEALVAVSDAFEKDQDVAAIDVITGLIEPAGEFEKTTVQISETLAWDGHAAVSQGGRAGCFLCKLAVCLNSLKALKATP
jgi:hypothetical protein